MKVKFVVPLPVDEKGRKNREAQLPKRLIHPNIDVKFVPVKNSGTWADSHYDFLLFDFFVFEEALSAEEEGYDAVCIDTMTDSGMAAIRSRLKIPVVGPAVATMHLAGVLGNKFSIITMWDRWFPLYYKNLALYHLEHKLASVRAINEKPDVVNLLAGKEEKIFKKLEEESLKAINQDGADVIILGSTTMHQAANYLAEHLPVPVLNPGVVAYKLVEMLLELGLSHSKKAFPPPAAPKDEMIHAMAKAVATRMSG